MPSAHHGQHRELDRYLLDGERVVTAVHQHWGKIAEPVATCAGLGVLALWVDATIDPALALLATALWWVWFAAVARAAYRVAQWRHDWFVATDKRLLLFYGFITRRVSMMPLMKVTDMSYERSVPGRVLGYGRFVMESAGQDQALREVTWVPDPDRHYRAICAEIFGVHDRERAVPEEGGPAALPDPYAALPDPYAGWPGPWAAGSGGGGSLYRSPDLRRDRSADTGPLPIQPPLKDERR